MKKNESGRDSKEKWSWEKMREMIHPGDSEVYVDVAGVEHSRPIGRVIDENFDENTDSLQSGEESLRDMPRRDEPESHRSDSEPRN